MAHDAVDRHMVVDEHAIKILDVFERGAAEGNLLDHIHAAFVIAPGRQIQLVVLGQAVLRGHEHRAARAAVAYLQAEDIPIEGN